MTCSQKPHERSPALSLVEYRSWQEHAAQCADCGPLSSALADGYDAIRAADASLAPEEKRALWARIDAARTPPATSMWWRWPALAAVCGALLLVVFVDAPNGSSKVPPVHYEVASPGDRFGHDARYIKVLEPSRLAFLMGPELETIDLLEGALIVEDLKPKGRAPVAIKTVHGRLQMMAGRARVRVAGDETTFESIAGEHTLVVDGRAHVLSVDRQILLRTNAPPVERPSTTNIESKTAIDRDPKTTVARKPEPLVLQKRKPSALPKRVSSQDKTIDARTTPEISGVSSSPTRTSPPTTVSNPRDRIETPPESSTEASTEPGSAPKPKTPEARRAAVDELLTRADRLRRRGEYRRAADAYAAIAAHPDGAVHLEEAGLRKAQMFHRLGDPDAALRDLDGLRRQYGEASPLAPERAATEARILLERNDVEDAARIVEAFDPDTRAFVLNRARIDVAERLAATNPERARSLVVIVLSQEVPDVLAARTRALAVRLEQK